MIQMLFRWYRWLVSPWLQMLGAQCRFYPSCSEYAEGAFAQHPSGRAWYLSIGRVLRCHPWHPGGMDPVPPQRRKENLP